MPVSKAYCNICNLWLNSRDQLAAHQLGKSHRRRENFGVAIASIQQQISGELTRSFGNQENGSNITLQSNIKNIDESSKLKRENTSGQNDASRGNTAKGDEYFCNICKVKLTSKSQADMHYGGTKHKKSLAVVAEKFGEVQYEGVPRQMDGVCDICNVPLSSKAVADAHYAGSKHERKLNLAQTINGGEGSVYSCDKIQPTPCSLSLSVITSLPSQIAPNSSVLVVPVPSGSVGQQHRGLAGGFLYCSFCGVSANSQQQMEAHWQGTRHKNHVSGVLSQANQFLSRPAVNQDRYFNCGQIISHGDCSSSNGQAAFRTRQSVPYVSRQY